MALGEIRTADLHPKGDAILVPPQDTTYSKKRLALAFDTVKRSLLLIVDEEANTFYNSLDASIKMAIDQGTFTLDAIKSWLVTFALSTVGPGLIAPYAIEVTNGDSELSINNKELRDAMNEGIAQINTTHGVCLSKQVQLTPESLTIEIRTLLNRAKITK